MTTKLLRRIHLMNGDGALPSHHLIVTRSCTCHQPLLSPSSASSSSIHTAAASPGLFAWHTSNLTTTSRINRLHHIKRHFGSSPIRGDECDMSSDNARKHNNADFKLPELFNVKDKVALVTGGGSGIGLMAVQALAVNGAKVYVCGRTGEKLETVAQTHGQNISGQIVPITADVTKKADVAKLYDSISQNEKHLDILINNAGISTTTYNTEAGNAEELKKALFSNEDATYEDWDAVFRTNVSQIFFMTAAFLPLLQKASESQHGWSAAVINISSISGQVKTTQHHPQYNASKAAAIHLTRMLAHEVQANGLKIRINDIAPGVFPSEMTTSESAANQKSHIPKEQHEGKTPAARPGNDRDMASAVLFVATNQFLNGQSITVDGGYTLAAGR